MSLVVPLDEIFANKTRLLANHESWERINLGEACTILNGFPFKATLFNKSEGFPIIRIRDIARSSTETFYSGDFPPEYIVKKGDLLIGMDGNFRCCEWQGRDAGLNQRVCKITPDERILHRKFLFYGLNGYLKAIEDVTSSVTVGHLSSRDVQRIPFPLPPLAEQRRIVAKMEALMGKVEASHQRLAKIPVLLKRFRQSVLAAACSGRITADWRVENPADDTAEGAEDSLTNVPDWQKEEVEVARALWEDAGERFLDPPDKFDFNEYRQMERFIGTLSDEGIADQLWRAIKGKGAFRYFKDTLHRLGIQEEWYRYRDEAMKEFAIEWAKANNVLYEDDTAGRRF